MSGPQRTIIFLFHVLVHEDMFSNFVLHRNGKSMGWDKFCPLDITLNQNIFYMPPESA